MTQLTKNFSLSELTKSNDAARHGIDNTPTAEVVKNLQGLADHILQPVRDHFGMVTVSSGFRCKALNEKIGGAKASDHMTGHAADLKSWVLRTECWPSGSKRTSSSPSSFSSFQVRTPTMAGFIAATTLPT